jgi:hypothetical protein
MPLVNTTIDVEHLSIFALTTARSIPTEETSSSSSNENYNDNPRFKQLNYSYNDDIDPSIMTDIMNRTSFAVSLMKHQAISIRLMEEAENNSLTPIDTIYNKTECKVHIRTAILGNKVGSGKTFCAISLILRNRFTPINISSTSTNNACFGGLAITQTITKPYIDTTIILVPVTILHQWRTEIAKFGKDIALIVSTNAEMNQVIQKITHNETLPPIILCSSSFSSWIENYRFKRLIMDEVNTLQSSLRCTIYANCQDFKFIWCLQADMSIRYNMQRSTRVVKFSNLMFTYQMFSKHIARIVMPYDPSDEFASNIHRKEYLIKKNVLLNNNDMLSLLDESIVNQMKQFSYEAETEGENVIEHQKKLYNQRIVVHNRNIQVELLLKPEITLEQPNEFILAQQKLIEELNSKIRLIDIKLMEALTSECKICCELKHKSIITPCCCDMVCLDCVFSITRSRYEQRIVPCPFCRTPMNLPTLTIYKGTLKRKSPERNTTTNTPEEPQILTRPEHINNIIAANPNGKFIVASDGCHMDHIMNNLTKDPAICRPGSIMKRGATAQESILKQFAMANRFKKSINVLFLTIERSGAGVNLQHVTDIIFYHPVSVSMAKQLIGRGIRIGRRANTDLHVHEFTEV